CGCSLLRRVGVSVLRVLLLLQLRLLPHLLQLVLLMEVHTHIQWRRCVQISVELACRIVDHAVVASTGFVAKEKEGRHRIGGRHHSSSCPAHSTTRHPQLLLVPLLQHRHDVVGRTRDGQRGGRATGCRHGESLLHLRRLHHCSSSLLHHLRSRGSVQRLL
ncbi:hypothetical protein PMAYCL1PPCAC_16302, partial [Pristionchus mayeri]